MISQNCSVFLLYALKIILYKYIVRSIYMHNVHSREFTHQDETYL